MRDPGYTPPPNSCVMSVIVMTLRYSRTWLYLSKSQGVAPGACTNSSMISASLICCSSGCEWRILPKGREYDTPDLSKVCRNGGSTLARAGESYFSSVEKHPVACATRAHAMHTHEIFEVDVCCGVRIDATPTTAHGAVTLC